MLSTSIGLAAIGIVFFILMQNPPAAAQDYPVQGFDVSHHQGKIDWTQISPKQYHFVYIKATEGGDYQDPSFQENWLHARQQGLNVGAYHYYRLCRDAQIQAQNFIATVPKKWNALAPVIDLEYDAQCLSQATQEQLIQQIKLMQSLLRKHYGKAPIFYVSKTFYHVVLMGHFDKTQLWIRDYDEAYPTLKDQRGWFFWQYSKQGKIAGIEQAVDLDVYAGSLEQWQSYLAYLGIQRK
ncbi:GH25 family lysozyme [Acinetobacter sp. MD2(2019)]|uniref:GH25 family lysozyme n=1 Tax=Acinetobacter sp. MD2(2019) TaxID=2605273 RepID=UPI002D7859F3|nr:GH25 family lysozyme [Acinetobacter sp. MD2(2019)]